MEKTQILFTLATAERSTLGNFWRITAKGSDFYLDFVDQQAEGVHLSVHGPNDRFDGHRFHVKAVKKEVASAKLEGRFVSYGLPRKGLPFDGQQITPQAFLVARIRSPWDLQRPRFRATALVRSVPEPADHQSLRYLSEPLRPNWCWDVDVVISYDKPYWPHKDNSVQGNARLGPLKNDAGMWLTATSYHRWQATDPAPPYLVPALPRPGETPSRITCIGRDPGVATDIFWFMETVTSREWLESRRVELSS